MATSPPWRWLKSPSPLRGISGSGFSIHTIAHHVKQLFYKVGVHDRAGLLAKINGEESEALAEGRISTFGADA